MVESSAAARKSFLLSLREKKTPLLRTNSDKRKGGTYIYIGDFWCSFQKKSGTFVQPFRTVGGLPCCPSTTTTTTTNLFPPWTVGSGWHCRFLPHQGPPKKKKTTCCSELSSFSSRGEEGSFSVSPRDIRWPFTHRGTIVCLFDSLFKLDADRIALDMCIATKKNQQQRKKKKNVNDGHFKYFYLSKHPFYWGFQKRVND